MFLSSVAGALLDDSRAALGGSGARTAAAQFRQDLAASGSSFPHWRQFIVRPRLSAIPVGQCGHRPYQGEYLPVTTPQYSANLFACGEIRPTLGRLCALVNARESMSYRCLTSVVLAQVAEARLLTVDTRATRQCQRSLRRSAALHRLRLGAMAIQTCRYWSHHSDARNDQRADEV